MKAYIVDVTYRSATDKAVSCSRYAVLGADSYDAMDKLRRTLISSFRVEMAVGIPARDVAYRVDLSLDIPEPT